MEYCDGFDTFPHRGIKRDDVRPGLHVVGFRRRATIALTVDNDAVTILGVFYGGQDYEAVLQNRVGDSTNRHPRNSDSE